MTAPAVVCELRLPPGALRVAAPEPLMISQRTSEAVLGLSRRTYLRLVAQYRAAGGEVICCGRLRLVASGPFVAWLRPRDDHSYGDADPDGETAAVLDGVGLRLASGGAR